jgi:hypothetical protein
MKQAAASLDARGDVTRDMAQAGVPPGSDVPRGSISEKYEFTNRLFQIAAAAISATRKDHSNRSLSKPSRRS